MHYDRPNWKGNWESVSRHYCEWWKQEGLVLRVDEHTPLDEPRADAPKPPEPIDVLQRHTDPDWFAANQRYLLSRKKYLADNLPFAVTDYGTAQLAACFGAEPNFDEQNNTVWYRECVDDPGACPELCLKKTEPWWLTYRKIMKKVYESSGGDYIVGMPSFGSNLDVLAELRGTQNLLYDLIDEADWVKEKLEEINLAFFVAFDDYYEQIRLADGSSAYTSFDLWGPGKVSQVQCDFAAMISPAMFEEFVIPPLQRQCDWLDHSMFHLDGPNCIGHLKHLLAIPELDAIQWMPGAGLPGAGDPQWYELYEQILGAGKSIMVLGTSLSEAKQVLRAFGCKGVYLHVSVKSDEEADEIITLVDSLRWNNDSMKEITA